MDSNQQNQEWVTRITAFKSSGFTMSAWCKDHELSLHQLKYRLKKLMFRFIADPDLQLLPRNGCLLLSRVINKN